MPKRGDEQQGRVGERSRGGSGVLVTVPAGVVLSCAEPCILSWHTTRQGGNR